MKQYNSRVFNFLCTDKKNIYSEINFLDELENHLNQIKSVIESTSLFTSVSIYSNFDKSTYTRGSVRNQQQYYSIDCYIGGVKFFRIIYNLMYKTSDQTCYYTELGISIQPESFQYPLIKKAKGKTTDGAEQVYSDMSAFAYNYSDNLIKPNTIYEMLYTDDTILISLGYDDSLSDQSSVNILQGRFQICITKTYENNVAVITTSSSLTADNTTPEVTYKNSAYVISNKSNSISSFPNLFVNSVYEASLTTLSYFPVSGSTDYIENVLYTPTSQILFSDNSSRSVISVANLRYLYTGWFAVLLD